MLSHAHIDADVTKGRLPTSDLIRLRAVLMLISPMQVVEHAGQILEKPDDARHAFEMLSRLSGSQHHVHTGVVLVLPKAKGVQRLCYVSPVPVWMLFALHRVGLHFCLALICMLLQHVAGADVHARLRAIRYVSCCRVDHFRSACLYTAVQIHRPESPPTCAHSQLPPQFRCAAYACADVLCSSTNLHHDADV